MNKKFTIQLSASPVFCSSMIEGVSAEGSPDAEGWRVQLHDECHFDGQGFSFTFFIRSL